MLALSFPIIDPIALYLGPFPIRWYGISYMIGMLGGWYYAKKLLVHYPPKAPTDPLHQPLSTKHLDDFLLWGLAGVILGGRFGYVIFYQPLEYLKYPLSIFYTWQGGMSFHGGLLGVVTAIVIFCLRKGISIYALGDLIACVTPIGLFFGRIANFINGELFGRPTSLAWGVVFPLGGPEPRHPSQLYEALLEGVGLFILCNLLWRKKNIRAHPGFVTGIFFIGYGLCRCLVEFVREPDAHIGYIGNIITLGQLLSLPLFLTGAFFIKRSNLFR